MSWAVKARRVRDPSIPMPYRVSTFHSLLQQHAPLGFHGTEQHLREHAGVPRRRRWPIGLLRYDQWADTHLITALELLEESRRSHQRYRHVFAQRRRLEKASGRRQPTIGDLDALNRAEWFKSLEDAERRAPSRRESRRSTA